MYVLGVDGGQTSLKCVILDTQGSVIGWGSSEGLLHLSADKGALRFTSALADAVHKAWQQAGMVPQPLEAAVLGLATVEDDSPETEYAAQLVKTVLLVRRVLVYSDAHIALLGAHGGKPGVVVIAGTGSHVRGMNARGEVARAGGWGWLLGDEGSAMWIGRMGLQAACRAEDGLGAHTQLREHFCAHFGLARFSDIKRVVYRGDFGAREFAALAPIVDRVAQEGDESALHILEEAGDMLARQVTAVFTRLCLSPATPVALVGGAFEHLVLLRHMFSLSLQRYLPSVPIVKPQHPPSLGAALKAIQLSKGS